MTRRLARRFVGLLAAVTLAATGLVALAAPAGALPTGVVIIDSIGECSIATIDLGTGAISNKQDTECSDDLAYGPDGTLYGIVEGDLVIFDPATGNVTPVGGPLNQSFVDVGGLTFDATGRLWLTLLGNETPCINVLSNPATATPDSTQPVGDLATGSWCLYQVDPATGAATFVAQLNQTGFFITNELGLAGSCDGRVLGNYDRLSPPPGSFNPLRLGSFNTTNGAITDIGSNGILNQVFSLDFEPATAGTPQNLWGVGAETSVGLAPSVFTIDQSTGLATATAPITLDEEDFVIALAIAPISCPTAVVTIQPTFTG